MGGFKKSQLIYKPFGAFFYCYIAIQLTEMKIQFWSIGKQNEKYVKEGVEIFTKRISNYFPVEWIIIPTPKNSGMMSEMDLRKKEGDLILDYLVKDDYLILLDERGKNISSETLAELIKDCGNKSIKKIIFLIGGAFGVDEQVQKRANFIWSISKLVFPHQLVRLILSEQIYRACTILRNEKYHHT